MLTLFLQQWIWIPASSEEALIGLYRGFWDQLMRLLYFHYRELRPLAIHPHSIKRKLNQLAFLY